MGRPSNLPQFQNDNKDLQLMQNSWAAVLNPVLRNPLVNGLLLNSVALVSGDNVINHRLGRQPQGFFLTDIDGTAVIYRSSPFTESTLTLNSTASVNIGLWVF